MLTVPRVMALCDLARRGATDDAGREFVNIMLDSLVGAFKADEDQRAAQKQMQEKAQIEARVASEVKAAEEKIREEFVQLKAVDKPSAPNGAAKN